MTGWVEKLDEVTHAAQSRVCIGLDPDPDRLPVPDVLAFNRSVIDATRDLVCAYKPNLAFYEALGTSGLEVMRETVRHIRRVAPNVVVIGDAKRGDVASTARAYARALFEIWDFDVATINPYLGHDAVEPFLDAPGRGALVLCRNSNPGAADLQDLPVGDAKRPLYEVVAEQAARWNTRGNLGLVVGATAPEELARIRASHPILPLLIPGVGAQGGDVARAARAGAGPGGGRMMIASARGILYASQDPTRFADAAREATEALRTTINEAL